MVISKSDAEVSFARRLARRLPMPLRQLPWRIKHISRTPQFASRPLFTSMRLLNWTARELISKDLKFFTNDGKVMYTMRNNFVGLFYYVLGEYEVNLLSFLEKNLPLGGTFVDVGANVGLYSIVAADLVGEEGRVCAIEAHPYTFEFLKRNIATNYSANITAFNIAVGEETGELPLRYEMGNSGSTHIELNSADVLVRVPVRTLDMILADAGINKVDFLKIDVEGFEPSALNGATEILRNNPHMLVQTEIDRRHLARYDFLPSDLTTPLLATGFVPHQLVDGALCEVAPEALEYGDVIWRRRP